jgi:hypothetical protein
MQIVLMLENLVIIDDLHVDRFAVLPSETNAVLLVDADTVLTFALAFERLKPVTGQVKVVQFSSGGEPVKSASSDREKRDGDRSPRAPAVDTLVDVQRSRVADPHFFSVACRATRVKDSIAPERSARSDPLPGLAEPANLLDRLQ